MHLPIQATNGVAHAVYQVCQELRRVNSTMLDKVRFIEHIKIRPPLTSLLDNYASSQKTPYTNHDHRIPIFQTRVD